MYLLVEEHADGRPTQYTYSEDKETLVQEAYVRSRSYKEFKGRSWRDLTEEEKHEYRVHCCGPYAYVHVVEVKEYIK